MMCTTSLLSVREADNKDQLFVGIFSIEFYLADAVLYDMWVLFSSSEF